MAVPIVAALAQLGIAGWQYAQGEKQRKDAKKVKPNNYVPPGVTEAVQRARMESNASIGPASKRGLERLGMQSSARINDLKRVGGNPALIQQGVMDTDAREKEAIKDLSVSDAAFKMDQDRNLQGLLTMKGQYEKEAKDASDATKSALTGAAMQNKFNALSSLGEGIINALPDKSFDAKTTGTAVDPGATALPASGTARTGRSSITGGTNKLNGLTPEQFNRLRKMGMIKGDSRFPQYGDFNLRFNTGLQ
jgi:hypothetical protein